MNDKFFVDTNVAIYAVDQLSVKGRRAIELLQDRPSLSTQVIMETVNVLIKKLGFKKAEAFEHAKYLLHNSIVTTIDESAILRAFDIALRYEYSHWDSLIIAAALETDCETLFSEDLKDGHRIEGLTIQNPFKK